MSPTLRSLHKLLTPFVFAVIAASGTASAGTTALKPGFAAIPNSVPFSVDADTGAFSSSRMSVELALAPGNQTEMANLLEALYDSSSSSYQQWLGTGEFNARFAPNAQQVAGLTTYLQSAGLTVQTTASPFLLRVTGSSSAVAAAFVTTLHNYKNPQGVSYFQNTSVIQLPSSLASAVLGVVGVTNTVRMQQHTKHFQRMHGNPPVPSCETGYATAAEYANEVLNGVGFAYGYGGGPGCSGLTPAQDNSLYGAPNVGPTGKGQGVNIAVFELSNYQTSDIVTWAHTFYGNGYTPPLVNINVDGGPGAPVCPTGDTCIADYSGDIEVVADIQMQLAIAPNVKHLLVYNAPNDYTGQTELDEYTQIANDNTADVISSSWSLCEQDAGAAYALAENTVFVQMALQGQSMFGAAGDTGAFGCLRSDGTTGLSVLDPPTQPWVTSVGGTSFENFNPDANPNPSYPEGAETVWNFLNLCNGNENKTVDGLGGLDWCAVGGAGGGGNSLFWGRPSYQYGLGITNRFTAYSDGATNCALAKQGTPCRESPDVSVNADEFTPYAEYCTGNASTLNSECGSFSSEQTPPGWFGIGGTSLSSPFMSAIIADRDSYFHRRTGNANPLMYALYRTFYLGYFHDITGFGQSVNNNGYYPTTFGYDLATGIGTPKMGALITGFPQF